MPNEPIIAVGAVGGSGTRVVAQILRDAGVYMGDELNGALDNLVFTRLFRDPEWYSRTSYSDRKACWQTFASYMSSPKLSLKERWTLLSRNYQNSNFKGKPGFEGRIVRDRRQKIAKGARWGWKEPNTQIFIEDLAQYPARIKYIHILRHGLDMAYSKNNKQLKNWGSLFDLDYPGADEPELLAETKFDYWCRSNHDAITKGQKLLKSDFFLLNFETLCRNPEKEVERLLAFSDLEVSEQKLSDLVEIPQIPESRERYKERPLSFMNASRINALKELGFDF